MKNRLLSVIALALLLSQVLGQTATAASSEQLSRQGFRASVCNIEELTISYTLDEAFGEPLVTSQLRWNAGSNTADDCLTSQTYIYLRVKKQDGNLAYIKLSPEIGQSGTPFGPTSTESPFWNNLICSSATKLASCLTASEARAEYTQIVQAEGFEVVAEASIAQQRSDEPVTQRARSTDDDFASDFSFDSLLEQAIDSTMVTTENPGAASAPERKPVVEEVVETTTTGQQVAEQATSRREELVEQARNNVVTLIATTFAEYRTPAHACESDRSVANWVRVTGTCRMNFRSEQSHSFLCENSGRPKKITSTQTTELHLGRDIQRVAPLRVSEDGWVALVLELKENLGATNRGSYGVDRWQLTGTEAQREEMEMLAGSLATLKQYCEEQAGSPG